MAILIWSRRVLAFAAIATAVARPSPVQAQAVPEPTLKAAFLLNFAKFTEWPAARPATAPIVLCTVEGEVAAALEASAAGRLVDQHPVSVTRVRPDAIPASCAVVYAGAMDDRRVPALVEQCRGNGVLVVGDSEAFAEAGGAIGFFLESGRMRFAINLNALERARLRLSAKLLSLAKIIKD